MTIDKTIATVLIIPLIGLVIPAAVYVRKLPPASLTASERELISFSSQPVMVAQPRRPALQAGLDCPIHPSATPSGSTTNAVAKGFPPGPIPSPHDAAQQKNGPAATGHLPNVSMIYSDGQMRMAVIDGHVLHEGTAIGSGTVIKIEKTRVLLRTSGRDKWLSID